LASIEEKVTKLVQPIINSLGYEIYDLEYVKEGKDYYLRIFIDKEDGITVDDCEKVNNAITDILDEEDYIKEQYYLEISSSGLERRLTKDWHFAKYLGTKVEAKLFKPQDKQKEIIGILKSFDKQQVTIEIENKNIVVERKNIALIKTVYDFNLKKEMEEE